MFWVEINDQGLMIVNKKTLKLVKNLCLSFFGSDIQLFISMIAIF